MTPKNYRVFDKIIEVQPLSTGYSWTLSWVREYSAIHERNELVHILARNLEVKPKK
jgi:hypothetical protein